MRFREVMAEIWIEGKELTDSSFETRRTDFSEKKNNKHGFVL